MGAEKILISVLLLGWRLLRVVGPLLIGREAAVADTESLVMDAAAPIRRANYMDGLLWITVLALLGIGVPLASADAEFAQARSQDLGALIALVQAHFPSVVGHS